MKKAAAKGSRLFIDISVLRAANLDQHRLCFDAYYPGTISEFLIGKDLIP